MSSEVNKNTKSGYVSEERVEEAFRQGAQAMRELLAQHAEQSGFYSVARRFRSKWKSSWGVDPGKPEEVVDNCWGG